MKKFLLLCLPIVYAVAFYHFASFIFGPYKSLGQAQILFGKGNKFLKIGAVEEALKAYQQTVELNPENAVAWNKISFIYRHQKKNQDALEACDQALQILPQVPGLWNNRGVVLLKLGRLPEAIVALDRSIELNPKDGNTWYNLALVYGEQKNKDQTLYSLKRALGLGWNLKKKDIHKEPAFEFLLTDESFKMLNNQLD